MKTTTIIRKNRVNLVREMLVGELDKTKDINNNIEIIETI